MLTYLGQTPGKHEPIDLSETCRQSLTLLQAAAPKGMILKADFPSSGPIIHANAGQIQQVLTNLVTNAWEAAGENRGTIGLTVKTVSHADIPVLKALSHRLAAAGNRLCLPGSVGYRLRDRKQGYREDLRSVFHHKVHRTGTGVARCNGNCKSAWRGSHGGERTGPGKCLSDLFTGIN